jgi:hypothetical protein
MNTQPLLSTYWLPLNEDGGNSAGTVLPAKDWAETEVVKSKVRVAMRAANFETGMCRSTKYQIILRQKS